MKHAEVGELKITAKPELRFEATYRTMITVLEGAELSRLTQAFFKASESKDVPQDPEGKFLVSVAKAFHALYGEDVVDQKELKNLSSADARKMDLFYRASKWMFTHMDEIRDR